MVRFEPIWRLNGELVAILKGHDGQIWRCDISADGLLGVTAGFDGTARVWTLDTDALIQKAQARLMKGHFELRDLEPYRKLLGSRIEELVK